MKYIVFAFLFLFISVFAFGCNSGGNSLFGSSADVLPGFPLNQPQEPAPEHEPQSVPVLISGHIVDLDGNPVPGVNVSSGKDADVVISDAQGAFSISIPALPASTVNIDFQKPPYLIHSLPVTFDATLNPSYEDGVRAYIPFSAENITNIISSLQVQGITPVGAVTSPDGKFLYISDFFDNKVKRLELATLVVTDIAGGGILEEGAGDSVRIASPWGIAVSADGDVLYVGTRDNYQANVLKRITGVKNALSSSDVDVITLAGSGIGDVDGPGNEAKFELLSGMVLAPGDDTLYICDEHAFKIKKAVNVKTAVSSSDITVSTVAGSVSGSDDGPALSATFMAPYMPVLSKDGNVLYVTDLLSGKIRSVSGLADSVNIIVSTIAGGGSTDTASGPVQGGLAMLGKPIAMVLSADGNSLYFTDFTGHKVKKITGVATAVDGNDTVVTDFAGNGNVGYADGPGEQAEFQISVYGMAISADDGVIYVLDPGQTFPVRRIVAAEK